MALYNKMRPKRLHDVLGQKNVVDILLNNIKNGNLPNAMLFVGTRGTGKTSVAKIFGRLVNCTHPLDDGEPCNECDSCRSILSGTSLDVQELDAASNNGVDHIRGIIENLQYKPFGKMKVVILDEVHMLSAGAFNALLKIMEEPPKNVLFILCTTEYHKVPATIISRCRKFQFNSISDDVIVEKLKCINQLIGKEAEESALYLVAKAAKGSMRDAESIYESFLDCDGLITADYVREHLGFTSQDNVFTLLDAIQCGEPMMATAAIEQTVETGGSLFILLEECMKMLMDVISVKMGNDISDSATSDEYINKISQYAFSFELQRLFEITDAFGQVYNNKASNMALSIQAMLIKLSCTQSTITSLTERVTALEAQISELKSGERVVCVSERIPEGVSERDVARECDDYADMEADPEQYCDYDMPGDESFDVVAQNMVHSEETNVSEPSSVCENVTVDAASQLSADEELRNLGFNVVASSPFEEELPDFELSNEEATPANTPVNATGDSVSSSQESSVPKQNNASLEASFFEEFARLFN